MSYDFALHRLYAAQINMNFDWMSIFLLFNMLHKILNIVRQDPAPPPHLLNDGYQAYPIAKVYMYNNAKQGWEGSLF